MEGTVLFIDARDEATRGSADNVVAGRLRMQGFNVVEHTDAEAAIRCALVFPPDVVVADLWMPKISGVQLCRLLGAEASTRHLPVILSGPDGQRNRFWSQRAGAAAYVPRGRMGDLVRAIRAAMQSGSSRPEAPTPEGESPAMEDVRDRIAEYLDQALFESVVAGEVRSLGTCCDFERLFDMLSQFMSQITSYRWLAVSTERPCRIAVHANPASSKSHTEEACAALGLSDSAAQFVIEDHDAYADQLGPKPIVRRIELGGQVIGQLALAVREREHPRDAALVEVIAREIAGPIRIATLVEESRLLATTDSLTGLANRRAFLAGAEAERARTARHKRSMAVVLFDVDHFKMVNDTHGHNVGDMVLDAVGSALMRDARKGDLPARWGGEEFIIALHSSDLGGGLVVAERLRALVAALQIRTPAGVILNVTASFGVACLNPQESIESLIDRADRAMYSAKSSGRNRVVGAEETDVVAEPSLTERSAVPREIPPASRLTRVA